MLSALEKFNAALDLAHINGLDILAAQVSRRYDTFLERIIKLGERQTGEQVSSAQDATFNIANDMMQMLQGAIKDEPLEPDLPIMFLMIEQRSGLALFQKRFVAEDCFTHRLCDRFGVDEPA